MIDEQMFGYPSYGADGAKVLTRMDGVCRNMLQDITVYRMKPGEERVFASGENESAVLLVQGAVVFQWGQRSETARRADFMTDGAYCLHVPRNVPVRLRAQENSEVLVQATGNTADFAPQFYTPENCRDETFGRGEFEGKAQRTVRTFFDYASAPYSHMVCGEIIVPQGGWSSYPPHQHPQPEVYYYRFARPQGFGVCLIGENAFVIRDGSFCAIPGGRTHPQVNAPGYPMYYVWMIRHFDNAPWKDRIFDPAHAWLLHGR